MVVKEIKVDVVPYAEDKYMLLDKTWNEVGRALLSV